MNNFESPVHFDRETSALWSKYYTGRSQSGSGIPGYYGDYYQQYGNGWLGNIFKRFALPVVKYFGKKAASTLVRAGGDALSGENFLESLKQRGKETAKDIVSDASGRASEFLQTGKGRRRRRRSTKRRVKKQALIHLRKHLKRKQPNRKVKKSRKISKKRKNKKRSKKRSIKRRFLGKNQNLFY